MNDDVLKKIFYCMERVVVFEGIDEVLGHIVKTAASLTQADAASMRLFNIKSGLLEVKAGVGLSSDFMNQEPLALGEGIIGKVVVTGNSYKCSNVREDQDCCNKDLAAHEGINAILSVPLKNRDKSIGSLSVYRHSPQEFSDAELLVMSIFAAQAVEAVEKTEQLEHLKREATYDSLTGIYNRRFLLARIDEELKRAERHQRQMSITFIDLDDFKKFNDCHGHLLGDKLLKDISSLFKEELRQNDFLGRIGGEEFIIVTPETDKNGAMTISRKLLDRIRRYEFLGREGRLMGISFSAGIASFPDDGRTVEELIRIADETMYQVKTDGKNGVQVASQA
nr:GGDEF domain-containing protein [Desulfobulbaceae bacterium]